MEKSTDIKFVTIPSGKMSSSVIVLDALTNELPVLKLSFDKREVTGNFGKRIDLDTIFTIPLKVEDESWLFAGSHTLYFSPSLALLRRLVIELFPDWNIDGNDLVKLTNAINAVTTQMTVAERQQLAQRAYSLCVDWKCKLKVTYTYSDLFFDDIFHDDYRLDDNDDYRKGYSDCPYVDEEQVLRSNIYNRPFDEDGTPRVTIVYIGAIILPVINEF